MEFTKPTYSTVVKNALYKIDWRKVIARDGMSEGPLTEVPNGIHDVLSSYRACNVMISRNFSWSLLREQKDWSSISLDAERTDPVSRAVQLAIDIVDVLWRALIIHYPKVGECTGIERSLQATLIKYTCLAYDNDWAKYLKFHTLALFSRYELDSSGEPQEIPSSFGTDQAGTLFIGKLNSICRQKASSSKGKDHAEQFRFTILQGVKKGLPLLDQDAVISNLRSGAKDLSSERVVPIHLLSEIERTVKEVIGEDLGSFSSLFSTENPCETLSTHACLGGPRKIGGALGRLYDEVIGDKDGRRLHFWDSDLMRMRYHPWLGTWVDRIPSWMIGSNGYLSQLREKTILRLAAEGHPVILDGIGPVNTLTEGAQLQLLHEIGKSKEGLRKIVFRGILEPLKVRPISVSHAEANHIWQPIQKRLWTLLQRFPCFKLTGTPVSEDLIQELVNETRTLCDSIFPSLFRIVRGVSADYRAATNVLALMATLTAVQSSTNSQILQAIMRNGLVGSWMHCIDKDGGETDLGVQTNGQLMGCVFSFPFLCLINAAVTRHALERDYDRRFTLRECPMLINGDDMLCFMTPSGYENWKKDTSAVGLEPSPGKNYFSDRFLMVNSRIFDLPDNSDFRKEVDTTVKSRPFVNFSFITGIQKSGCAIDGEKEELSEDHCLKAISTFDQSFAFHRTFSPEIQERVERNIWERRNHLWKALGLSTTASGFNLHFSPDIQPDNKLDYVLARLRWGPYRKKLAIPAERYDSGPDYSGAWRLQVSLARTTDVWSECSFIRRAILGATKVCTKYRALVTEVNNLTAPARDLFVSWTRFSREISGAVKRCVLNRATRWNELFEVAE